MTSPKTPQQLADAIETVVASYLDEVRRTVQRGAVANNCENTTIVTRVAPYISWITAGTGTVLSTTCATPPLTAATAQPATVMASVEVITPFGATTTPDANEPPTPRAAAPGCSLAPRTPQTSCSLYAWTCGALLYLRRRGRRALSIRGVICAG